MNRPPMQVNPVFSSDDGSYQGSEVQTQRTLHNGMVEGWDENYSEDEYGRLVYSMQEEDLTQDTNGSFDEEEYISALMDSLPVDYNTVIEWASQNLPNEILEEYNKKIDTSDLEGLNEAIEQMLEHYYEANGEPVEQEPEVEVSDEEFNDAYQDLTSSEPEGTEVAYQWLEAAEQTDDPAYRDVYMLTAEYHRGNISPEEALEAIVNKYGLNKAAEMYKHLSAE